MRQAQDASQFHIQLVGLHVALVHLQAPNSTLFSQRATEMPQIAEQIALSQMQTLA